MSCSRPAGVYIPCSWTQCHGGCPYWHDDYGQTFTGYYMYPQKTIDQFSTDELLAEIRKRVK